LPSPFTVSVDDAPVVVVSLEPATSTFDPFPADVLFAMPPIHTPLLSPVQVEFQPPLIPDLTGWLWTGLIERISQDRRSRTCGEVRRRARSRWY